MLPERSKEERLRDLRSQPPTHQAGAVLPTAEVERIRRTRRHPRPTQFDFLHLRCLLLDLTRALRTLPAGIHDVLDVYCGTRPYEDFLPADAQCTGLDVTDAFGSADVVTDEFLPFPDASFDLVLCVQAFYYVPEPAAAARELARVLRPGGWVVISVPLVWEYGRRVMERRFTGPQLAEVFTGWKQVRVVENGGRGVAWSTLTGRLLNLLEGPLKRRLGPFAGLTRPLFDMAYLLVNLVGATFERIDRRLKLQTTLPMNLLLTAERP